MKNKELLELAAKAVGYEYSETGGGSRYDPKPEIIQPYVRWNPLIDDGDALRLAVRLQLRVLPPEDEFGLDRASVRISGVRYLIDAHDPDPYAATRRAIVMAAAEIGKGMK